MAVSENSTTLSTLIPSIGMTFAKAAERVRELVDERNSFEVLDDDEESKERERDLCARWSKLERAILTTEPKTLADALAVLDRLLCPDLGLPIGMPNEDDMQALTHLRALISNIQGSATNGTPDAISDTITAIASAAA